MDRRLASGDLDKVWLSFMRTDGIKYFLDFFDRFMILGRVRVSETDGTSEIAFIGDLDDRETSMLLMIRTDPTVMRTTMDRLGREVFDLISRLVVVLLALEVGNIGRDEDTLFSMFEAVLQHVDPLILEDDLGIDGFEALRAQCTSEFVEDVRTLRHILQIKKKEEEK